MSNIALKQVAAMAANRLEATLRKDLPFSATRLIRWRSPFGVARGAFVAPAFPVFYLPYWVCPAEKYHEDIAFHVDLAYSTLHYYLCIRMIDDVADGDGIRPPNRLLPTLTFLYSRNMHSLYTYFPHDHPFWDKYMEFCDEQADATVEDAFLTDVGESEFLRISSRKANAAKFTVAAAAFRCHRPNLIDPWCAFVDRMSAIHQLWNDLDGALKDHGSGNRTIIQSRFALRAKAGESIQSWLRREGLAWARSMLVAEIDAAVTAVESIGREDAVDWMRRRSGFLHHALEDLAMRWSGASV